MYKQWTVPCEAMFEDMAYHSPNSLIELVRSGALSPGNLTLAAQWLGEIKTDQAKELLFELAENERPLVREGAIYGLSIYGGADALGVIKRHATEAEPSRGVRAAAGDILDE
jgi:HEAT repeat protein